jgi:hypothetical protein
MDHGVWTVSHREQTPGTQAMQVYVQRCGMSWRSTIACMGELITTGPGRNCTKVDMRRWGDMQHV